MAMAETALIMTVPCHWAFMALHLMGGLIPSARFRMSSRKRENGFVPPEFCVVPARRTKHFRLA
jgi:hypothetical protein